MKQPTLEQRKEYMNIVENSATIVPIQGTKRSFKLRWMHPYTIERITKIWIERDIASAKVQGGDDVARDLVKEPYFAFKEAALMILNHDIKIRLFYGLLWRWLAFRYTEVQMAPVIAAGKKKLPLMAHYETMVYSLDMRTDMMRMTAKEADQYRAELLLDAKRLSARTSRSMAAPVGGSEGGSATSATGAS
jgi:hypothetical protein